MRLKRLLCIFVLSLMLVGCAEIPEDNWTDLDNVITNNIASDVDLDNVFGVWYLNYRGAICELGSMEISDFRYDFTETQNNKSGNFYHIIHLYFNDSYYMCSRDYGNNGEVVKLSDEQVVQLKKLELNWVTYDFNNKQY